MVYYLTTGSGRFPAVDRLDPHPFRRDDGDRREEHLHLPARLGPGDPPARLPGRLLHGRRHADHAAALVALEDTPPALRQLEVRDPDPDRLRELAAVDGVD